MHDCSSRSAARAVLGCRPESGASRAARGAAVRSPFGAEVMRGRAGEPPCVRRRRAEGAQRSRGCARSGGGRNRCGARVARSGGAEPVRGKGGTIRWRRNRCGRGCGRCLRCAFVVLTRLTGRHADRGSWGQYLTRHEMSTVRYRVGRQVLSILRYTAARRAVRAVRRRSGARRTLLHAVRNRGREGGRDGGRRRRWQRRSGAACGPWRGGWSGRRQGCRERRWR